MNHAFNIDIAEKYGIKEAILIENIAHWIKKNYANKKHIHEGKVWSYNSVEAFKDQFPYMSAKQIRYALNKLEDAEVIKSGNYNKAKYDRTKWYTIIDKSICHHYKIHLPLVSNGNDQEGEPIPDINTDINQIKNKQKDFDVENPDTELKEIEKIMLPKNHYLDLYNRAVRKIKNEKSNVKNMQLSGETYDNFKYVYQNYTVKDLKTALIGLLTQKNAIEGIFTPHHLFKDNMFEKYRHAGLNNKKNLYDSQKNNKPNNMGQL